MGLFLVDTNVLVYAYDPRDPGKRAVAQGVLEALASRESGVVTSQVLGEFYRVVTRKIPTPLTHREAERSVTAFTRAWTVLGVTQWTVLEAIRGVEAHGFSFWDSMIWASAKLNQVPNLLSEDFSPGTLTEGVRFTNPFDRSFDLADVLGLSG